MAVNNTSSTSASSIYRVTGLATGMDTDDTVAKLMSIEKQPLNKLYQKKQIAEWKRDDYRDISKLLLGLKSEFMDVTSSINMRSQSSYKKFTANAVTSTGAASTVVSAQGSSTASAGTHTITVQKMATAQEYKSTGGVTKNVEGTMAVNWANVAGKELSATVDGVTKTMTIGADVNSASELQTLFGQTFGNNKIEVADDGLGYLTIGIKSGSGANKITLNSKDGDALSGLGFGPSANLSNRLNLNSSLEDIANSMKNSFIFSSDKVALTINGTNMEFSKDISLGAMMDKINSNASSNVYMRYDELNDSIRFVAKQTGAGDNMKISETGSTFLQAMTMSTTAGTDAQVTVDGNPIVRSNNSFSVDGVTYNLLKESNEEQTVTLSLDTDGVYKNISDFVKKYNDVIDKINTKLTDERNRDYTPLTSDQKEDMDEDEIKAWEEKAKSGYLRNDSTLQKVVNDMRTALYDSVSGVSSALSSIGITTGTYSEKGKLYIDETKLKKAISTDINGVMNLFSQESTTHPGTTVVRSLSSDERKTRYKEEGLVYRLYDIVEDNVSMLKDKNGYKGALFEKAGYVGDGSEYSNIIYDEINDYNDKISDMLDKLDAKETAYYRKFAAMEQAISKMNNQSSSLISQLSSS